MTRVRRALDGEGVAVARLIRASLPASIEGLTIWHCRGVADWVEERIAAGGPSFFYVTVDERDQTIAAAEFRMIEQTVFLNQIGVNPSHQGAGIGRRLFAAGLRDLARRGSVDSLVLDVDPSNERAYAWYGRLGLAANSRYCWSVLPISGEESPPGSIEGWEEAERDHARFGFSRFQISTSRGAYSAGRLGDRLFRLTDVQAWRDPAVHATLHDIDANRRILLISKDPVDTVRPVRQTERLVGTVPSALARLPSD